MKKLMSFNSARAIYHLAVMMLGFLSFNCFAQDNMTVVFDSFHRKIDNPNAPSLYQFFNEEVFGPEDQKALQTTLVDHLSEIEGKTLAGKKGLVIFSPNQSYKASEKKAIVDFIESGGSLLLIFDEERRTPLKETGINEVISPFGIKLTDDAPVRHNCGALVVNWDVCSQAWELPYSGGRSVQGGKVISRVYDRGDYVHSAFVETSRGGKIIVMADGMTGLLMGAEDGIRFSGTGPMDSKYWGKHSREFMGEILKFWLN
ncbi:hypothetical protein [Negadavirga shengliensis]|uniref:IFT52 GIFT domain-containing protein n=1 Tax=Negadavirga shengliensis TaxID=1389218 RepID=A0ABV9T6N9_9BACT